MTVFQKIENLNQNVDEQLVVTIGNFDGVHQGHRDLIAQINKHFYSYKLLVITFRPHPIFVLDKSKKNHLLQTYDEKIGRLQKFGVDYILELDFNDDFRAMDAAKFTYELLFKIKGIKSIALGHDFSIGSNGHDSKEIVKEIFKAKNLEYLDCMPFELNGSLVSSSKIREFIQSGDISIANTMLGTAYRIKGFVKSGKKIGTSIGFPTANLELDPNLFIPKFGVYKVKVHFNKDIYDGLLNIGNNPTVSDDQEIKVECHILNFNEDLYGKLIEVEFEYFIRDEMKFTNVEELKAQISKDINFCRLQK